MSVVVVREPPHPSEFERTRRAMTIQRGGRASMQLAPFETLTFSPPTPGYLPGEEVEGHIRSIVEGGYRSVIIPDFMLTPLLDAIKVPKEDITQIDLRDEEGLQRLRLEGSALTELLKGSSQVTVFLLLGDRLSKRIS